MVFEVMAVTAAFFGALYCFCMRLRVGSGVYRALVRSLCALTALIGLSFVPGVRLGVNLLNVAVLALLSAPGAVLLQVVAMMP